jgi:hypothetical protein
MSRNRPRMCAIWAGVVFAPKILVASVLFLFETALAGAFLVSNSDDQGNGSLRWAMDQANAIVGLDTVNFEITGFPPFTI